MSFHSKTEVLAGLDRAKAKNKVEWRDNLPTWCPGCGHFSALDGLYEAVESLKIPHKDFVTVSGIGCSGRFPFFIKGFGLHALHGRALPIATGIKIANPELSVVVVGGDGDGVGIGGGHLPHAARNNFDMTYILLDNSIYGLTKGQTSPTSPVDMITATTPYGNLAEPLNPTTLALTYGASFVARVFSRDREMVSKTIQKAMKHKGFSIVHQVSPCVEFNKTVTYKSVHGRTEPLPKNFDPTNLLEAQKYAMSNDPIYLGIFHQNEKETFEEKRQKSIKHLKK